jgi:hypothetical protein
LYLFMRLALPLCAALSSPCRAAAARTQSVPPTTDTIATSEEAAAPSLEPWPGGLPGGLDELARRIAAGDHAGVRELVRRLEAPDALGLRRAEWLAAGGWRASALRVVDPAIEQLRLRPPSAALAGELALVDGVAALRLEQFEAAQAAFLVARAEGRGATRLEAIDALADRDLAMAEALRPGQDGAPPAAATPLAPTPSATNTTAPKAPSAGSSASEDPIAKARAAYLVARARLVERLRLDRHDADARANLELVQRRLEELRRLEDQRREEERKQQEQQQQEQQQEQRQDQQDQQPDQRQQEQQQSPKDQQQDQQQAPEGSDQKDEQQPQPAAAMSKEEAQKLLDKLKELEEKGEELRATLLRAQRQKVDKDW